MKKLKVAVLAALLAAAAAGSLLAAPRCGNGQTPRLSGDLFSPVECSTATKAAAMLPGLPVRGASAKTDLKDLEGSWEGGVIHALGRYDLRLTVKSGRAGKAELTVETKELQFRERLTTRLTLVPSKERGSYETVLTSSMAPDASMAGTARIGSAPAPDVSTSAAKAPEPDRQADLSFTNGAVHRLIFALKGKEELRVRAFSGTPGAPLQKFELALTRAKR